ncbi:hypothetical protein IWQ62_001101 [Dispira parvispora]|uniref:UBR-type domain-containing protein n=1 Tax=Dispira parvispora TaxID=1520584 RepID=A0A9W8AYP2_9FUNG|nr:hypothetical protein IWQ62_001101 [Dispira parvispora]
MTSPLSPNANDVTTAVDFLQQQTQLEKEAEEVLPGKFDQCTFSLGYLHQPVYACLTCSQESRTTTDLTSEETAKVTRATLSPGQPAPAASRLTRLTEGLTLANVAGFCYSCSIACHADHEVIELFNKRHFRCDCGTTRLNGGCCQLEPNKGQVTNEENQYNHNFLARYCWCDTVYEPDVEERTMFQCAVCQDWFHDTCVGMLPENDDFEEYVCPECVEQYPKVFKRLYRLKEVTVGQVAQDTVHKVVRILGPQDLISLTTPTDQVAKPVGTTGYDLTTSPDVRSTKRQRVNPVDDKVKEEVGKCSLALHPVSGRLALFCQSGWRQKLCQCNDCYAQLKKYGLLFILEDDCPYEPEKDTETTKSIFELGMNQLFKMNKAEALDGIMAYNRFRDELKAYLAPFASDGRVVTEQDVRNFFEVSFC